MNLAFSALPCENWSIEHAVEVCAKNKIGGIELRLGLNDWTDEDMPDERAAYIRAVLKEKGVTVTNIGSDVKLLGYYGEMTNEKYKKSLRLAKLFNAKGVRVFLGNFVGRYSARREPLDYGGIVRWIKNAADFSEDTEIWIETHNEFATGRALAKLLSDVNKKNCKVIWDIIHPIEQGEQPGETLGFIGDSIAHIHIKDGKRPADPDLANWIYTKLGEGELPIAEIVRETAKRGFNGFYSLEWESKWRGEINGADCGADIIIPEFAKYMFLIDKDEKHPMGVGVRKSGGGV
jgi:sugar phosphate isomerase/epimerase